MRCGLFLSRCSDGHILYVEFIQKWIYRLCAAHTF